MHCKSFAVRLAPPATSADTAALSLFLTTVDVSAIHSALVAADTPFWSVLVFYRDQQLAPPAAEPTSEEETDKQPSPPEPLTPTQQAILDQLKLWRRERARQDGVPVYVVAHNAALEHLVRRAEHIQTLDDLRTIERLGPIKIEKYGAELLELLRVATEQ